MKADNYALYPYRYANLLVFLLASSVNSLPISTLASIATLMQNRFNYSPTVITLALLMGPISHPFMATPCNWILDKFGVRFGCSLGGILVVLGTWARLLMQVDDPAWMLIAAILAALGNIFILSSPSAFAIKWFSNESVPKVIASSVLLNLLSSGFGASIGGLVLN